MKVGDLVRVKAPDDERVYAVGVYLGVKTTWKDWHMVHIIHPWQLGSTNYDASPFDEPFWKLEVINESR